MTERLEALSREGWADFFALNQPRCPHCGNDADIGKNDLGRILEEGEHEIDCPTCEMPFAVSTRVRYSFSTDKQEARHADQA